MAADRSYVAHNDKQRERLRALLLRLSDQDLSRPMPGGWTVAGVLSHLAFWDQRIIELVGQWNAKGADWKVPDIDEENVDWINDAAKPMFLALPPRVAAQVALSVAETVDRCVAGLTDAQLASHARPGGPIRTLRAEHRQEHLDEIERLFR